MMNCRMKAMDFLVRSLGAVLISAAFVAIISSGCGDEEPCGPETPAQTPDPTLDNIWPDEDGTAWTFELTQRTWQTAFPESLFSSREEVPPAPSMEEVQTLLTSHPIGDSVQTERGMYRLKFDGIITTLSGVTAKNLEEFVFEEAFGDPGKRAPGASSFLARLYQARPDLRTKILQHLRKAPAALATFGPTGRSATQARLGFSSAATELLVGLSYEPVFLHGYAWKRTDNWIGTYGDVDTLLAWKFLEASLEPGASFRFQLVPSLADDVFLHALILGQHSISTELGTFEKAVECLYMIDYGVGAATDEAGELLGYYRTFEYGTVVYAPTVGPVSSYERRFVEPLSPPTAGTADLVLSLVGTNAGR